MAKIKANHRIVNTKRVRSGATNNSRALTLGRAGVKTATQFATFSSALMTDVLEGSITPEICNASAGAGRNLLKVVEMQYKYGKAPKAKPLLLA